LAGRKDVDSISAHARELAALNALYAHVYDNLALAHKRYEGLIVGDPAALEVSMRSCLCV
jgi:hypothetical protein